MYVSDALVSFAFTPVYVDGDEIEDKNACGAVVVNYKAADSFKRGDVTIELVTPDPFLSEMLSGGSLIDDGGAAGFAAPPIGVITGNGVSVELWTKRILDGDLDPNFPYAHWVYPKISNLRLAPHTHAGTSLHPSFSGQALQNPNWYDGPVGDWGTESDKVYQWLPTATIPTPSCAYQNLVAS
jgi:hypothetical protein